MSERSILQAVHERVAAERLATANRLWQQIEKQAGAPNKLTDPIGLSWLALLRIFDAERQP